MSSIYRMRVKLTGAPVIGPSVTTFYMDTSPTSSDVTAVRTFFTSLEPHFPLGLYWEVPDGGDVIEATTGAISGAWGTSTSTSPAATGTVGYAEGVGVRVRWGTAGVVGGRHVVGTTFLVPLEADHFGTDGLLLVASANTLLSIATTLVTSLSGKLTIWSRPTTTRAGGSHAVLGASVPRSVSWLRSRRT